MLNRRFVIVFSDGRKLECDTAVTFSHSLDAKPTSNPVEADSGGVVHIQDHVVVEPRSTNVEAIVSDTPLDFSLQPDSPGRVLTAVEMLETAVQAGKQVQVNAGLRTYARATLGGLEYDETQIALGQLRFKITVHELVTATSRTATIKRRGKSKAKHSKKAHKGMRFADQVKGVIAGTIKDFTH